MTDHFVRAGIATGMLAATAALCAPAFASDNLDVTANGTTLGDEHFFNTVTIAASLRVNPYDGTNHGWLHIRAHSITIAAAGAIDATGAGYRGDTPTGAEGHPGGVGGTAPPGAPAPGGGGAHLGPGANGQDGACQPFIGAEGGSAYDSADSPLGTSGMGSAGGTSHGLPPNNHEGPGADGGGVIWLEAATIQIDGTIRADGVEGSDPLDAAPGGGGGGTIIIHATTLTVGGSALLSAVGGVGAVAHDPQFNYLFGGGGGGGLILIMADNVVGDPMAVADVSGGQGNVICTGNTTGSPGLAVQQPGDGCLDADGDGHRNLDCGGDDCDDGDANIFTGAAEQCDNVDHNCDGDPVDQPQTLCPQGSGKVCDVDTEQCVTGGAGGGGVGGAAAGSTVELSGGLCTARQPMTRRGPHGALWLLAALGLMGLWRRHR